MVKSHIRRKPLELPRYPHPGKFEGEIRLSEFIWDLTMEGGGDKEFGDVSEYGQYHVLVRLGPEAVDDVARQAKENGIELTTDERQFIRETAGTILMEDSAGFVSVKYYDTKEELDKEWAEREWLYEHWLKAGYGQQQLPIEYEDDD